MQTARFRVGRPLTPAENQLNEEGIVLLNRENRKAVVRVAGEHEACPTKNNEKDTEENRDFRH